MSLPTIYSKTFDITGPLVVASGVGGRTYSVVGLLCHNNERETSHRAQLRVTSSATDLYGSAASSWLMAGRGDHVVLPINIYNPYFVGFVGNALFMFSNIESRRISGIIYYIQEDA